MEIEVSPDSEITGPALSDQTPGPSNASDLSEQAMSTSSQEKSIRLVYMYIDYL